MSLLKQQPIGLKIMIKFPQKTIKQNENNFSTKI